MKKTDLVNIIYFKRLWATLGSIALLLFNGGMTPLDEEITLQVGETRVYPIDGHVRVVVGNPDVIHAAHDRKETELVVTALNPGFSHLHINGRVYAFTIHSAQDLLSRRNACEQLLRGLPTVEVLTLGDQLILDGRVHSELNLGRATQVAERFDALNLVRLDPRSILEQQQVRITFRFAEVRRDWSRAVGIDWEQGIVTTILRGGTLSGVDVLSILQGTHQEGTVQNARTGLSQSLSEGGSIGQMLDVSLKLNEADNLLRLQDKHVITTLDGQEGTYQAGGTLLIPVAGGVGQGSVEEKDYGVIVSVTPTLLDEDRIRLDINYEVSALLSAGDDAYSLSKRGQTTTVVLDIGDLLVLASQLEQPDGRSIRGIPFVKNLPFLGALFGVRAQQSSDTEAAIFVSVEKLELGDSDSAFDFARHQNPKSSAWLSPPGRPIEPSTGGHDDD